MFGSAGEFKKGFQLLRSVGSMRTVIRDVFTGVKKACIARFIHLFALFAHGSLFAYPYYVTIRLVYLHSCNDCWIYQERPASVEA